MFQSTRKFMFRPIASLGHFKIHPPLPLTPRESTQLLTLLITSFRQQLDREHGTFRSEASGNDESSASLSSSSLKRYKLRRHSQSRLDVSAPTDRHFHSILTNPLFKDVKKSHYTRRPLRDPMEIFDEACSKGYMKVEYATACLKAKKKSIVQSPDLSLRDSMKSSGAGSKVLKWLSSSGVADDVSFLNDDAFSGVLVDFLVAEGLHSVVWTWLETMFKRIQSTSSKPGITQPIKDAARLLEALVKSEASGYVTLDTAFASMGRAKDMLSRLGCGDYARRIVLRKPGAYLFREIIFPFASHPASSPEMFDLFLSIVPEFSLKIRTNARLSHLWLHHPTKPKATLAIKCLKKVKNTLSNSSDPQVQRNIRSNPDPRIISLGLDTARYLLEFGQYTKAQWVMNFLQETYAEQLGICFKKQFEQARAEASNLELLESLKLA